MKVRQTKEGMNDVTLRRLSHFDTADFGPQLRPPSIANLLAPPLLDYHATVILAASIVDVVRHERADQLAIWRGRLSHAGNTANLGWLRGRRNHFYIMRSQVTV